MSTPPAPPAPEPADHADLPTVPVRYLAGRYRLDRVLGRGAMGKVWAAHDEALGRWVAIKEVDFPPGTPISEMDQVAERAMREARAIASVSDPHVVTIFDLLTVDRAPAIVMELLEARSLAEVLSKDGPIGDAGAAIVGLGVAEGLLAAHAAGITHRDVKPGNVLLCRDGRIKLTDFGIARSVGENTLTATGLLLGSPAYISPEVAAGRPATTRSDAWGLGALLYACVQGVPPFDRGNPLRTLTAVVQDPVPAHGNSGRLSGLITGLLVKDPAKRMTVAQAHQLLRTLADDPAGLALVTHAWKHGAAATRSPRPAPATRRPPLRTAEPDLPPPPWAGARSAESLRALPTREGRPAKDRHWGRWASAVLLALVAALAGFFGVRAVAQLGTTTSRSLPAATTRPAAAPSHSLPPGGAVLLMISRAADRLPA